MRERTTHYANITRAACVAVFSLSKGSLDAFQRSLCDNAPQLRAAAKKDTHFADSRNDQLRAVIEHVWEARVVAGADSVSG
jgi:hypothetical protein